MSTRSAPVRLLTTAALGLALLGALGFATACAQAPLSGSETPALELARSTATEPALPSIPLSVSRREIALDGRHVAAIRCAIYGRACREDEELEPAATFAVDPAAMDEAAGVITPLCDALVGRSSVGELTVMADRGLPYRVISAVVATAAHAGFHHLKFAVISSGSEP